LDVRTTTPRTILCRIGELTFARLSFHIRFNCGREAMQRLLRSARY
jgi:hypothetical protein